MRKTKAQDLAFKPRATRQRKPTAKQLERQRLEAERQAAYNETFRQQAAERQARHEEYERTRPTSWELENAHWVKRHYWLSYSEIQLYMMRDNSKTPSKDLEIIDRAINVLRFARMTAGLNDPTIAQTLIALGREFTESLFESEIDSEFMARNNDESNILYNWQMKERDYIALDNNCDPRVVTIADKRANKINFRLKKIRKLSERQPATINRQQPSDQFRAKCRKAMPEKLPGNVLPENLQTAVKQLKAFIPSRPSLPVLSCVHVMTTAPNRLTLEATNLEIGIRIEIGGKFDRHIDYCVPYHPFSDAIALANVSESMRLFQWYGGLTTIQSNQWATFKGIPGDEFPAIPALDASAESLTIEDTKAFKAILKEVITCASKEDKRPILTGIHVKNYIRSLHFESANGYKTARRSLSIDSCADFDYVIPARTMEVISKIAPDDKPIKISKVPHKDQILIAWDNVTICSQLIAGKFPDVGKVEPETYDVQGTVDSWDLRQALRRVAKCKVITLESLAMGLRLSGDGIDQIDSTIACNLDSTIHAQFDRKLFADMVNAIVPHSCAKKRPETVPQITIAYNKTSHVLTVVLDDKRQNLMGMADEETGRPASLSRAA